MPLRPSRSDVHINRPLTMISIAMMQMAEAFVSSRVFPNISVPEPVGRLFCLSEGGVQPGRYEGASARSRECRRHLPDRG